MANDLTGNPWKIDTASATPLTTNKVRVRGISWISKTAVAGDDVEVTDAAGKVKWASVAAGANMKEADKLGMKESWNGVAVPVLDSGYLLIEFDLALWPLRFS